MDGKYDCSDDLLLCCKWSSPVENPVALSDDKDGGKAMLKVLVEKLFPEYKGQLRKKQQGALEAFVQDPYKDLVLAVPTAYGKTAVYILAAVYFILKGGKAVIHIPYQALMSDIAVTFTQLTEKLRGIVTRKSFVDKKTKNAKAYGLPTGGSFDVPSDDGGNEDALTFAKDLLASTELTRERLFNVAPPPVSDANDADETRVDNVWKSVEPKDYEDKDLEELFKDPKDQDATCLNRFLIQYGTTLHYKDVRDIVETSLRQEKNRIKRIIIFLDNVEAGKVWKKTVFKRVKESFESKQGKKTGISTTHYHGELTAPARRFYEKKMSKYVPDNHVHVIIATSALEAGVNVRGTDMVIVPDAVRCSKASLVQRIGRGGREERHPCIVILGLDTGSVSLSEYLKDPGGGLKITKTPLLVLDGYCKYLNNFKTLGYDGSASDTLIEGIEKKEGIAGLNSVPEVKAALLKESPACTDEHMNARGISSKKIQLYPFSRTYIQGLFTENPMEKLSK
eukprot:g2916.t1